LLPAEAIVLETDAPDIPPHWLYRTAAERAAGATARATSRPSCRCIAQTLAELRAPVVTGACRTDIGQRAGRPLPGLA